MSKRRFHIPLLAENWIFFIFLSCAFQVVFHFLSFFGGMCEHKRFAERKKNSRFRSSNQSNGFHSDEFYFTEWNIFTVEKLNGEFQKATKRCQENFDQRPMFSISLHLDGGSWRTNAIICLTLTHIRRTLTALITWLVIVECFFLFVCWHDLRIQTFVSKILFSWQNCLISLILLVKNEKRRPISH